MALLTWPAGGAGCRWALRGLASWGRQFSYEQGSPQGCRLPRGKFQDAKEVADLLRTGAELEVTVPLQAHAAAQRVAHVQAEAFLSRGEQRRLCSHL